LRGGRPVAAGSGKRSAINSHSASVIPCCGVLTSIPKNGRSQISVFR
jgi:hypothetical protein